jgi:Amt family ammonium transporter
MDALKYGADALFIMLGAIMILAMHAGFAFLELGTVRKKNQVNALVKILVDFAVSTIAYFFIGYSIAYGINFFSTAEVLSAKNGFELVKFFFLLTFAAAIPAIVSGGIAERAKFYPQLIATALLVGFVYPFFEGIAWNHRLGIQEWLKTMFSHEFHDFAGSVVVHAVGAGLHCLLCCYWERVADVIPRMAPSRPIHHPTFHFSPLVPGYSRSAGLDSMS